MSDIDKNRDDFLGTIRSLHNADFGDPFSLFDPHFRGDDDDTYGNASDALGIELDVLIVLTDMFCFYEMPFDCDLTIQGDNLQHTFDMVETTISDYYYWLSYLFDFFRGEKITVDEYIYFVNA